MVEFALVAPIFFLLVFGILQLGLLFGAQNGLVNAVRDTARRAATYRINDASFDASTFPSICAAIESDLASKLTRELPGFSSSAAIYGRTISYEWQTNPDTSQYFLVAHVTATYKHPLYVPIISSILDGFDGDTTPVNGIPRLTLGASEQMRVENPSLTQPALLTAHTCP